MGYNKDYTYPWIGLWKGEGYPVTGDGIAPLIDAIGKYLKTDEYINSKPEAERNTQGEYIEHPCALYTPWMKEFFKNKNMKMDIWRQSVLSFMTILPNEHLLKHGYKDDMDTLLVFAGCDYSDPNYAEYVLKSRMDVLELADKERCAVILITGDKPRSFRPYVGVWSRMIACLRLNYERFLLDVSSLVKHGEKLSEVEKFNYSKGNPDEMITYKGGIPFLDVSGIWTRCTTVADGVAAPGVGDVNFDLDALIHSETGFKLAEASALNAMFMDSQDPKMFDFFDNMGVECTHHELQGENWVSFVPKSVEESGSKLPCVAIFGEMGLFNSPGVLSIFGTYYEYIRLAAQGQLIAVFFALESADDNDLLSEIIVEAAKIYPIDESRVYLTGHSHNGRYVEEFARRHHHQLAAIAPMSIEPGHGRNVPEDKIEHMSSYDMPTVFTIGTNEIYCWLPLHSAPENVSTDSIPGDLGTFDKDGRILSWQRRLKSDRCFAKSYEEIEATAHSKDIVERKTGIPADRTEVVFLDGFDNYIADVKNIDGKYHLRVIAQENCPHTVIMSKITLGWSFMKRFSRNLETDEIVELY